MQIKKKVTLSQRLHHMLKRMPRQTFLSLPYYPLWKEKSLLRHYYTLWRWTNWWFPHCSKIREYQNSTRAYFPHHTTIITLFCIFMRQRIRTFEALIRVPFWNIRERLFALVEIKSYIAYLTFPTVVVY